MSVLLAPARLPLSIVEEGLDSTSTATGLDADSQHAPQHYPYWRHESFALRHEYLQSLALGEDNSNLGSKGQEGLNVNPLTSPISPSFPKSTVSRTTPRRISRRSLSESFITQHRKMATAVANAIDEPDTAPSSPPELSYSKSSKSSNSSLPSDSSDDEEPRAKLSNFEDISMEEVNRSSLEDSNLKPESRPTLKRPPPRSMTTVDGVRMVSSPTINIPNNRYPGLRTGDIPFNSLPNGLGLRRGFSSPSAPSLFTLGSQRMPSSRSPSPTKPFMHNGVSVSPQTLASATPRLSAESRSPNPNGSGVFARRKSWQPSQRKTAKEIEADYNDEDEEVPAEAILENVPISPMPGQPGISQSLSRPQSRSTTPSPQRRPSYTNLHSANVPKGARRPSVTTILPNGQYGASRSPRRNRPNTLHHTQTMPAFPPGGLHRKQRSKSWTDDLNEEARELSAALEAHAERLSGEKLSSEANSRSSSPTESPIFLKDRAKSATFELPSVQRGNIMIDPLPISKEKEAVLTRTRPSWLPPKCQREEKRHLKEWEQMMARAAENEKKRALKEKEKQENQEEMKGSIARIWDQHVLPNWDVVVKEPRTRELWWRGVTPRSRGVVWQKAIGNELELSETSFDVALKRAEEVEERVSELSAEERSKSKEAAWLDAISRDISNACPEISATEKRAPLENALSDVLRAYAMYRSDVGYVYGTHLIAGILCLHLPSPADAFITLANMLNKPVPLAFHVHDTTSMARTYDLVLSTLKYKFPSLHAHLTSTALGLQPHEFLDPVFRCLFTYHLPVEVVSRIWDIFVFEGDKTLVRACVAVLGKLEGRLYGSRDEILDVLGWINEKGWDVGGAEEFILAVREAGKVEGSKGDRSPA